MTATDIRSALQGRSEHRDIVTRILDAMGERAWPLKMITHFLPGGPFLEELRDRVFKARNLMTRV